MKAAVEKKLISGIIVAIASVLAILVVLIFQSNRQQDTAAIIKHTNEILYRTQEVLDVSQEYELGVKNFLLTGDSVFLDSIRLLEPRLPAAIGQLRALTTDNPAQERRIDSLQGYLQNNRSVLQEAIRMSRGNDFNGVAYLVGTGSTTGFSHQARDLIVRISKEQQFLLEQRRAANRVRGLQLQGILWVLIGAVVILALVTLQKVRIDLLREKIARERLRRSNEELEEKVRLQTGNLQASEEKYKTLFYKSPLPKWIYDVQTLKFLEVNDAAIESYGYSQEEFQRMTIADIRPPEDVGKLMEDVEGLRERGGGPGERGSGQDVRGLGEKGQDVRGTGERGPGVEGPDGRTESLRDKNWRHSKKNGEVIFVEITAHPVYFGGRRARMVVVNDVTEQKKSEELLQRLNEDLNMRAAELTASNAELERFAYIASHDLQEPLRMVSSFLQLLQKKYKGQLDAKADQYIFYAVDGAERMKALIMDLLEYSRVGTGKESFGPVDTAAILSEVGEVFREQIISTRARIEIGRLPVVLGDKVQLTQLFQNLVGNALKYHSDRPPLIRIGIQEGVSHWKFAVADNGIGIDPQFFDKIFIIFQRLHNKSEYSGTGIGLAICKKIVERHGGRIWVESAPGEGSIFFFTIVKQP